MKIYHILQPLGFRMYKYIVVFFCICNIYTQVKVDPLYANYYRPGMWWPVRFTTEDKIPLKVSVGNFNINFASAKTQHIGYSLVDKSLIYIEAAQTKKHISLQTLQANEQLVGIYTNSHFIPPPSSKHFYYLHLKWLPDLWEGLTPLNCLFIDCELTATQKQVVKKWVAAGGHMFVKANFMPEISSAKQKVVNYGRGQIHFIRDFSSINIVKTTQNNSHSIVKVQVLKTIPPFSLQLWSYDIYLYIALFCLLHILGIFFLKSVKRNILLMSILTILNTLILTFWLKQYYFVHYNTTQLHECISNNETLLTTTVHSLMSPQNIHMQQPSTQLPMPTSAQAPQSFTKTDKLWLIDITNTKQYVFQTFAINEYIGSVQYNSRKFINDSEKDWRNIHFREQNSNFFLGDCLSGNSVLISQGKKVNTPLAFTHFFSDKVLYSFQKKIARTKIPFAFREEYEIHYISLDSNNIVGDKNETQK